MSPAEFVKKDGRLLALIVRADFNQRGAVPFSEDKMPLQLVVMNKETGEGVDAHVHPPSQSAEQIGRSRHEVLHVSKGKVEVGVYEHDGRLVRKVVLSTGDTILLTEGHSTRFLEDTKIIEVKEGVYPGKARDKIWLAPESDN